MVVISGHGARMASPNVVGSDLAKSPGGRLVGSAFAWPENSVGAKAGGLPAFLLDALLRLEAQTLV
jgi:hypothetical protein